MKRPVIPTVLLLIFLTLYLSTDVAIADISANYSKLNVETNVAGEPNSWPMAGANPARTSWTAEEIRGKLDPVWFKPIEPYISQRVQIIASDGLLFISTARGLYALDAATGAESWVYPTEMPLGHSPTIDNGVAYVGGFDHRLHAVDAQTGAGLWTFTAGAGFQTNPLVVDGVVYAGNRDGAFYAVRAEGANTGQLAWKYQTAGPILYSAAYHDGIVYFASDDSYAYALDAITGDLIWKSEKLPGAGFTSWWPVVYQDKVIFSGSNNYRQGTQLGPGALGQLDNLDLFPRREEEPAGVLIGELGQAPGDWAGGTPTVDATPILDYFAEKPWRRTVFVLDQLTGEETDVAPVLWTGNDGAHNRYPPVVGSDGVLYQQNSYMSSPSIPGGQISGWQPGNTAISIVSSDWGARDEPHAAAAGGNLIYWNMCCDRSAGAFDVSLPNAQFARLYNSGNRPPTGPTDKEREWGYFGYNLDKLIPGYNVRYFNPNEKYVTPFANYGGPNGVYGFHSDVNPPIPYRGRVYIHRSNAIIAFGDSDQEPVALPMAATVPVDSESFSPPSSDLEARLAVEVQKMLDAGHLRPGYLGHGQLDLRGQFQCGDNLVDYWHQPAETILTLLQALPHLPDNMQDSVRAYIQHEFNEYPPYEVNHIGWSQGAAREAFDTPPEVETVLAGYSPKPTAGNFAWKRNPYGFYALWKYAEAFGEADSLYQAARDRLDPVPPDEELLRMPFVQNAFIAGYLGYLELEKLAGEPESSAVRSELERLLEMRVARFSEDSAYANVPSIPEGVYCRTLSVASNFMYIVPELALYLQTHARVQVQTAVNDYSDLAPYWFVSFASEGYAENSRAPLYDGIALFLARAWILDESAENLEKYLDVPGFAVGDLYYIQKLVAAIEAQTIDTGDAQPSFSISDCRPVWSPPIILLLCKP